MKKKEERRSGTTTNPGDVISDGRRTWDLGRGTPREKESHGLSFIRGGDQRIRVVHTCTRCTPRLESQSRNSFVSSAIHTRLCLTRQIRTEKVRAHLKIWLLFTWRLIYWQRPSSRKDSDALSLSFCCFRDHATDVSSDSGDRAVPSGGHSTRPSRAQGLSIFHSISLWFIP